MVGSKHNRRSRSCYETSAMDPHHHGFEVIRVFRQLRSHTLLL
jgi:hypothetical protein